MYLWQHKDWPGFYINPVAVKAPLQRVLALQARLVAGAAGLPRGPGNEGLDKEAELDALIQSAIKTSEIEGESLNVESVRSSVARHLGLEQAGRVKLARQEASLVQMLVDAVSEAEKPLTQKMLCQWQAALFPEPPLLRSIAVGELRQDALGPMQVVSQQRGKIHVHFEAPPANVLKRELKQFLHFYNDRSVRHHAMVHAAVAHLYFITLHPFDDGNGRIARALTDRVLAQSENSGARFYSLSAAIEKNKKTYYRILEDTQKCRAAGQAQRPLDVTEWVLWFLQRLEEAMEEGLRRLERVLAKARFWRRHAQTVLSERQIKVLNRLLDGAGQEFADGLAARHYQAITGVSKATATRDLVDLQEKGCLTSLGIGGRSVRYVIQHKLVRS